MFSTEDTIVAIATPPGRGGIGVVRISGPASHRIARRLLHRTDSLTPRYATVATIPGIDQVVATFFAAPHSYTGQDVIEISAHGSPVVLRAIVDSAMQAGARLAGPGEFTFRAFLSGRLDLVQSEAVADLIDASTPLQARTAFDQLDGTLTSRIAQIDAALFDVIARLEASLDFPDEGFHFIDPRLVHAQLGSVLAAVNALLADGRRGRTIREGARVVIAGRTNAGKSSIFNELAGHDRAIVTDVPGTTRDLLSENVEVDGLNVLLVDTAGVRESSDLVEREGIDRAWRAATVATLLLVVLDQSRALDADDRNVLDSTTRGNRILIRSKVDLPAAWEESALPEASLPTSVRRRSGFADLRAQIAGRLTGAEATNEAPSVSNARHVALLERVRAHLARAVDASAPEESVPPEEFLLTDLQQARQALEEMTGRRTPDDLLQHIFERFCVGK